jgi:hypothetical protein
MVYPTVWAESKDGKLIKRIWMSSVCVCVVIVWASHLRVFSLPASNRHKLRVNNIDRMGCCSSQEWNDILFYYSILSNICTFSLLLTFFYSTYLHLASSVVVVEDPIFSQLCAVHSHLERERERERESKRVDSSLARQFQRLEAKGRKSVSTVIVSQPSEE